MKEYNTSIFIFRRELRLEDNIGLLNALKMSKFVLPIFIITPEQITTNKYRSDNCVQFMCESLDDLNDRLKKRGSRLRYFYGEQDKVIEKLIKNKSIKFDAVFANIDYTPYSIKRDSKIQKVCLDNEIDFNPYEDYLLHDVGSILTGTGKVYTKYTPFYKKAINISVNKPLSNKRRNFYKSNKSITGEIKRESKIKFNINKKIIIHGGRNNALTILNSLKNQKKYDTDRDILTYKTTHLSAYIKFGLISIREVYWKMINALGKSSILISQLLWREFFYNCVWKYPRMISKYGNYDERFDKINWNKNNKWLNAWKNGKTGYPIVDAAMRQMNETGYMHNRGRLIVANWLVKLAGINWKEGELYFAQTLVDYDPINNVGGWSWNSGSGPSASQWFRTMNPWTQGIRFDEDCEYIKKWVPELKKVDSNDIHEWYIHCNNSKYHNIDYPSPIFDYKIQREQVLQLYKSTLK